MTSSSPGTLSNSPLATGPQAIVNFAVWLRSARYFRIPVVRIASPTRLDVIKRICIHTPDKTVAIIPNDAKSNPNNGFHGMGRNYL